MNKTQELQQKMQGLSLVITRKRNDIKRRKDAIALQKLNDLIKKHTVTIRQDIAEVLAKAYAECKVQGRQRKDIIVLVDGEHWQNHFHTTCIMKAGIDGWEAGDPIFSDEKPGSRAMVKTWDGYTLLLMPMLRDATDQEIAAGWCFREK